MNSVGSQGEFLVYSLYIIKIYTVDFIVKFTCSCSCLGLLYTHVFRHNSCVVDSYLVIV